MGFFEKVLPGYKGYKEREEARNTDKLLREHLAGKLREARSQFEDFKVELTRRGDLDIMNPAETVSKTLTRVMDRLRYANYGFSGRWFGQQIGVGELEQVYEFDRALSSNVEAIGAAIRELEPNAGEPTVAQALRDLASKVRELDEALNGREQILRTLGSEAERKN